MERSRYFSATNAEADEGWTEERFEGGFMVVSSQASPEKGRSGCETGEVWMDNGERCGLTAMEVVHLVVAVR